MFTSTFFVAFLILLPVLFVMGLGAFAGYARQFDQHQVQGLNALVLEFALPASLFVGIVTTSRHSLLAAGSFVLATLIVFVGLFVAVALCSVFIKRRGLGEAAIQASCCSFSNVGFIGLPILTPLFGPSSTFAIAVSALILMVVASPLTVVMSEYNQQSASTGKTRNIAVLVGRALVNSLKKPVVWAPVLATTLVLLGLSVPKEFVSMLNLIGAATSGVALFVSGLILAAYRLKMTVETVGNSLVKMLVQPLLMVFFVRAFGIDRPLSSEAILLCTLPTAVVPAMFALHYHAYEAEAASTLLLTTLAMIIVVPLAIALTGA